MSSLPEGWRRLTRGDAAAVARTLDEDEQAIGRRSRIGAADVLDWWLRTDLEQDSWALEEDGRIAAVGWCEQHGDDVFAVGAVHPADKSRGLGTVLLDLSEARARELGAALVRQGALGDDESAERLLEARGYRAVRRHYEMTIELDGELSEPELPDGLSIDTFRTGDEQAFHATANEAFAEEWGFTPTPFEEWWAVRKDDDHSLWFVVRDGGEIAAFARCDAGRRGGGFVGMLGVRKPWRRRGLGLALLRHAFREFRRRGAQRVGLGVDAENPTGATRLYERAGMHVESEFVTFERQLV
jgi:mycothiol synthase